MASARADGDHGGSCVAASHLPLGATLEATHEPRLDRDVFRLDVASEGIVTLEISGSNGRESRLRMRGRDCADAGSIRYVEQSDLRLVLVVELPGSYFFEVSGRGARDGSPYTLRSRFVADREEVDLLYHVPADALDACSALVSASTLGVKSDQTDELDPVVPVPPPKRGASEGFILVPLQPRDVEVGAKSDQTDELDPVVPVPPPKRAGGLPGEVVVLTESIDPSDTDLVLLRSEKGGFFVIDAEGAAVTASLFTGSSCRPAAQVVSGVRLDRAGALVVPAGEYVLRLDPEPEAAGRYWLRIKHLVAAGS